jgi:hypothetical protein
MVVMRWMAMSGHRKRSAGCPGMQDKVLSRSGSQKWLSRATSGVWLL